MLKLGNTTINSAYLGDTQINKMYLGSDVVYQKEFLPTNIPGLVLWLDASDTGTIVPGATFTWVDKSSAGNSGTQSTAGSQPVTGTRNINSLNVLDFDGTADKIVLPSGLLTIPTGNNTAFFVGATDNATKTAQYMLHAVSSTSTRYRIAYLTSGTQFEVVSGTASVVAGHTVDTNPHIHALWRGADLVHGAIDGTVIVEGAALSVGVTAMAIGTQANNTANAYDGRVGECLIYSRNLSQAEGDRVNAYLSAKWAISVSGVAWPNATIVGFGDSITAGTGASSPANRWLNLLSAENGYPLLNQGISGTVLQNSLGLANNGRDRYAAALTGANKQNKVYILYGLNDLRYTADPSNMNLSNFIIDYKEVIEGLLAAGYTPDDIYVGSPTWIPVAGYSVGTPEFTGSSEAVNLTYGAAVKQIATDYGLWYAPVHENMLAYPGGPALLVSNDDIHTNDAGNVVIFESFQNSIKV